MWDVRKPGSLMLLDMENHTDPHAASALDPKKAAVRSHTSAISHLAFASDPSYLLSTGCDGRLRLWDAVTGKNTLMNYHPTRNTSRAIKFCVSPDAPFVFYPDRTSISMFDMWSGRQFKELRGHFGSVSACVAHPFLQEVYSCAENTILAWDVKPSSDDDDHRSSDVDAWSDEDAGEAEWRLPVPATKRRRVGQP